MHESNEMSMRGQKKKLVTGSCHLCAAQISLLSVMVFVLSACLCMTCMRAFCLRMSKLNRIYSEGKAEYTRMVLWVFLS